MKIKDRLFIISQGTGFSSHYAWYFEDCITHNMPPNGFKTLCGQVFFTKFDETTLIAGAWPENCSCKTCMRIRPKETQ